MIYLILAGLVLVGIVVINVMNTDPMPEDMEEEDDRNQRMEIVFNEWIVRPRAAADRLQDLGGSL